MPENSPKSAEYDAGIPALFERYEQTVTKVRHVVTVTADNITQVAKAIGGMVDYSGPQATLVVRKPGYSNWRVRVGDALEMGAKGLILNANGFNSDGKWTRVSPPEEGQAL